MKTTLGTTKTHEDRLADILNEVERFHPHAVAADDLTYSLKSAGMEKAMPKTISISFSLAHRWLTEGVRKGKDDAAGHAYTHALNTYANHKGDIPKELSKIHEIGKALHILRAKTRELLIWENPEMHSEDAKDDYYFAGLLDKEKEEKIDGLRDKAKQFTKGQNVVDAYGKDIYRKKREESEKKILALYREFLEQFPEPLLSEEEIKITLKKIREEVEQQLAEISK